jgi:hypothetical protein
MRAWSIVLFILAIHAGLAMFNYTNIMDIGLGVTLDPVTGVLVPGNTTIDIPSSTIFNASGETKEEVTGGATNLTVNDFFGDMIESILGAGARFSQLIDTFKNLLFSIHYLAEPIFGDFNAWILEAIVDFIFVIALFQMVTGRSFKTME